MLIYKKRPFLIVVCTCVAAVSFYSLFPILSEAKQEQSVQVEKSLIMKIYEEKPLNVRENNKKELSKQEKEEPIILNGKKERPDKPMSGRPELRGVPGFKEESKRIGL